MKKTAEQLIERGDYLFSKRYPVLSYWQEVGDHFYPQRAEFTAQHSPGESFADHLTSSYPILAARELSSSFAGLLRRDNWFEMSVEDDDDIDHAGKAWLEEKTDIQRGLMYDRRTQFVRATKEGDADFAIFGQAVLTTEIAPDYTHLLYRCWHLRDVVWAEGITGIINEVHRRWNPTASQIVEQFGRGELGVAEAVVNDARDKPHKEIECRHILMPFEAYDLDWPKGKKKPPFISIFLDVANKHIMEESPQFYNPYTIPRWQTESGSQYAHSPATIAALPDARLIQTVTWTLLQAGEKYVNPPMIGVQDALRSDMDLQAGGFTAVDAAYDERLGEVLRPLFQDKSGMPIGFEIHDRVKDTIAEAFYLNKLNLPPAGVGDMTATEISQRVQEYIRQVIPLFEPIEEDYNGSLCETTSDLALRMGAFGSFDEIPESLRGRKIQFKFKSPIREAGERSKVGEYAEALQILGQTAQVDPSVSAHINIHTAFRDAVEATGAPAKWMVPEDVAAQNIVKAQQMQEAQQLAELAQQGGVAAQEVGKGVREVAA